MIRRRLSSEFNFMSSFDTETGHYIRTGILKEDEAGVMIDTGFDPFMAEMPELIDIGVMGTCTHGKTGLCIQSGVKCYQSGLEVQKPNMTLENYKRIIDEVAPYVYQVALGGRGDVDEHENFEEILAYTHSKNIVPNFTTSGLGMTPEKAEICKKYCGAVAISWYRHQHTLNAIDMLLDAGVKTNIHYVLSKNTIDEAVERLLGSFSEERWKNGFPVGINAVVFLLHKPVGLGTEDEMLSANDPKVQDFFKLIDGIRPPFKIGFDSCTIPGIVNYTSKIDSIYTDTCEGARWSMYITADMKALPCSFDQNMRWAFDIQEATVRDAWNSMQFEDFRSRLRDACPNCSKRELCMGGCPIKPKVVLCESTDRLVRTA